MIEPIESLTFSLHANKGAYCLLLGSGLSTNAGIPTGWQIVGDLIRQLAKTRQADCEPDPYAWFQRETGQPPDYSKLLADLAKTPTERQQLLRSYIEPSAEDMAEGRKVPTKAHKAIARLVAAGHFRVILTTNFDRLIETALKTLGIEPTVVSTPSQFEGVPPLHQISCLLVKLHGDYQDSRIKNTESELAKYDARQRRLLAQVFENFGLIVCGWSAAWDLALRERLEACKNQRFSLYWAAMIGKMEDAAGRLVQLKRGVEVPIQGADEFFEDLQEKVESLEELRRPHPVSTSLAVASLKRYLPDPTARIRIEDLLYETTERAYSDLFSVTRFPLKGVTAGKDIVARLEEFDAILKTLGALLAAGVAWGQGEHLPTWVRALRRLAFPPDPGDGVVSRLRSDAQGYPALRIFYQMGVSALAANQIATLAAIAKVEVPDQYHPILDAGTPFVCSWATMMPVEAAVLKEVESWNRSFPMSEHLADVVRNSVHQLLPRDEDFRDCFDTFEYTASVIAADLGPTTYRWLGRYARRASISDRFLTGLKGKLYGALGQSLIRAGLFGGDSNRLETACASVEEFFQSQRSAIRFGSL